MITRREHRIIYGESLGEAIAAARDEHGLDKWFFALTREFMPPDKHRYAVVPERHVVTIPAHDLPHRDEVMHITDEVLERLRGGGWGPL
jgi:hypothetical protein